MRSCVQIRMFFRGSSSDGVGFPSSFVERVESFETRSTPPDSAGTDHSVDSGKFVSSERDRVSEDFHDNTQGNP